MDFILTQDQQNMLAQITQIISDTKHPEGIDRKLLRSLQDGGFIDLARSRGREGVLDAALATSEIARQGMLVPFAVHALVLPLFSNAPAGEIAAIEENDGGPSLTRYGGDADMLVHYEGDEAQLYNIDPSAAKSLPTNYIYPYSAPETPSGKPVACAPAALVRKRQRLGIAAEAVGIMDSLLARLTAFLSERQQFGRPLAAFQAIHHRLAELSIELETSRWFMRYAAWNDDEGMAASAAATAVRAGRRFCWEAHQLAGARGFTLELGFGHDTLRLQALSVEAGGPKAHEADAYNAIWAQEA